MNVTLLGFHHVGKRFRQPGLRGSATWRGRCGEGRARVHYLRNQVRHLLSSGKSLLERRLEDVRHELTPEDLNSRAQQISSIIEIYHDLHRHLQIVRSSDCSAPEVLQPLESGEKVCSEKLDDIAQTSWQPDTWQEEMSSQLLDATHRIGIILDKL